MSSCASARLAANSFIAGHRQPLGGQVSAISWSAIVLAIGLDDSSLMASSLATSFLASRFIASRHLDMTMMAGLGHYRLQGVQSNEN